MLALVVSQPRDPANAPLAHWVRSLELRLAEQAKQIERLAKLKQFVPAQLVDAILSDNAEHLLKSHRREIVVVFVDLRGFTAFAETAAPEDVAAVLSEYQAAIGMAAQQHEGTLERFTGDGAMIFFNDPVPIADPAVRAVRMALDLREKLRALCAQWCSMGHKLGFGIGIAQGYATIGAIGFEARKDYAAIGTVTNLANRLCCEASDGAILVAQRVAHEIRNRVRIDSAPAAAAKGFAQKVNAYRVLSGTAVKAEVGARLEAEMTS